MVSGTGSVPQWEYNSDMSAPELVVLVDEQNTVLGTMPKSEVHAATTPLHRAFSLFLFNRKGELLLQQRSHVKKTWPLVWSNSCCGHPGLDEAPVDAASRRLWDELHMRAAFLQEVSPYRYTFVRYGIMENEICPIVVGFTDETPSPNPEEVESVRWIMWQDFIADITAHPGQYSEWCEEEAHIIATHPRFIELYHQNVEGALFKKG
jgi:isopentenyl-diphosphate delta-isomerase